MITHSIAGIFKSQTKLCLQAQYQSQDSEPVNFHEAVKHKHWRKVVNDEFQALKNQGTWRLVPSTRDQRLISCKWVFKIKIDSKGNIAHYKAILVAKRFNQQLGLDFSETFTLVIKMTIIQLVLSLALHFNWCIQ